MISNNAPRDGSWILLMYEEEKNPVSIGRWQPESHKIGSQTLRYEWLVWTAYHGWDMWPDDRVVGWAPLPPIGVDSCTIESMTDTFMKNIY
jgi:hypothetical protein